MLLLAIPDNLQVSPFKNNTNHTLKSNINHTKLLVIIGFYNYIFIHSYYNVTVFCYYPDTFSTNGLKKMLFLNEEMSTTTTLVVRKYE